MILKSDDNFFLWLLVYYKLVWVRPWHRFGRNRFESVFEKLKQIRFHWDKSGLIIRSILAESWTSNGHLLVLFHCSICDLTYQIERQHYLDLLQPWARWSPGSSDHGKGDRQGESHRDWIFQSKSGMLNRSGFNRFQIRQKRFLIIIRLSTPNLEQVELFPC